MLLKWNFFGSPAKPCGDDGQRCDLVCTGCCAPVVHRLCEFGAFLAQEVTKICILMRKSISLMQVWAESRTSGENRHRILQVIHFFF